MTEDQIRLVLDDARLYASRDHEAVAVVTAIEARTEAVLALTEIVRRRS
jgi:hypothetical protein